METTLHMTHPRVKIALTRTKSGYHWAVEVSHEDPRQALTILEQVEQELQTRYGTVAGS